MALASTPLSRHGVNAGAMTDAREATKLAQQLATDLQVTGIQCVEALVEWMLEAGAQAETPPPFLWRGRNYFLKMISDLDFAEEELQARGVNLDCFRQRNPLLIKPNQKLGRVLAAQSIIMEMIEFAKEMTPKELLDLSGRMRDSGRDDSEANRAQTDRLTSSSTKLDELGDTDDPTLLHCDSRRKGQSSNSKKVMERQEHESAADLVNLLDESLDFIRSDPEGGVTNQAENNDDTYDENSTTYENENSARRAQSGTDADAGDNMTDKVGPVDGLESSRGTPKSQHEATEVEMPVENQSGHEDDSVNDDYYEDNTHENTESEASKIASNLAEPGLDESSEPEQVNINSDTILPMEGESEVLNNAIPDLSPRTDANDNQSEYDNSFDAEAEDGDRKQESHEKERAQLEEPAELQEEESTKPPTVPENSACEENQEKREDLMEVAIMPTEPLASPETPSSSRSEENTPSDYDNSFDEDGDEKETNVDAEDNQLKSTAVSTAGTITNIPPVVGLQHLADPDDEEISEVNDSQTVSKRLVNELKRWTFLEDENRPTESISACMEGSIILILEQYGLAVTEAPLESLLSSEVAQELDLAAHLFDECQAALNDICSVVAIAMQLALQSKNPLVSEIGISEVLEVTEAVRQGYHDSAWEYLKIASALIVFLRTLKGEAFAGLFNRSAVSSGLSSLVKVFYPYLVNQPREELCDNWHPVSSVFAAMGLPIDHLYLMLDPMCKTLLLAINLCNRSNQDSQDEDDLVFPKVTIVCDRSDVLQSSVEYAWRSSLSSEKINSNFSVFPFFKSSFGEKLVDGSKVEEGEGNGPLKEWFGLVGKALAAKWKQVSTSKIWADNDKSHVTAGGNTITIPGAADVIRPGFQVEWDNNDGQTISRVVNKSVQEDNFLLDRGVPSFSFPVTQLRVSQPNTAVFEYIKGSESYWLNENTSESPESCNRLIFVGWFLASAITHFSSIQLRIHLLFFRLLLNPDHCVTLEDIRSFDQELFRSLSGMKDMKPSDFAEYLKFEGADESLTVEAYIAKVLEDKFGPASGIRWQLDSIRRGFIRVIAIDQLRRIGIEEADLADVLCICGGPADDFAINEVFRIAADSDFTSCRPLMNAFWQTVSKFEPQLKRKFVKFVTGVDTLPLAGTEMPFTAISAADHEKSLQMLPQAHVRASSLVALLFLLDRLSYTLDSFSQTCDNTIELPNYWKAICWREQHDELEANSNLEEELARLLKKKLRDAVEYSSGYGLDGTSAIAGVLADKVADAGEELAKEESYDSLGLPALSEGQSAADLPIESSQPSPQVSDHDNADDDGAEEKAEAPAVALSPTRLDESYDDYDWEEEEQSVS
ncbi:unnamed protein product [Phytophthora lilii]|uniref:HECT-type E3 ubiquitin transferase n=1 Tax=Phytophthora lilii TaxID=2077276 RepID=A0A9W6WG84_9STRA|nr:unnamed protein product [Phytophthora lilii]